MARGIYVLSVILLIDFAGTSVGQTTSVSFCRVIDPADRDPAAYAKRVAGYCDGSVFRQQHGPGKLPVIGVTAAPFRGEPMSTSARVTVIPARTVIAWPLQLQGIAREPAVNYRLDAALLSQDKPIMVGPESAMTRMVPRLQFGEVAWAAWSDAPATGRTYIPVLPEGAIEGPVEITVRPTISVASLIYSVRTVDDKDLKLGGTIIPKPPRFGAAISFHIPPGEPQLVWVSVTAVGSAGDTQAASFRLVRPSATAK